MTIALAAIPKSNIWMEAATLAAVAVMITVAVYGAVALIVKADDVGLHMAERGRLGLTRRFGEGIVKAMPGFLKLLMIVGTAAMLWVGGSIILHALHEIGFHAPYEWIKAAASEVSGAKAGFVNWLATAVMDGLFGIALGLVLVPFGLKVITPLWQAIMPRGA